MKTLFVLFILFLSLISSSNGSLVTPEEERRLVVEKAAQEEKEWWAFSEEANDFSNHPEITNRWEIGFQLVEALLDAEDANQMICISLQPRFEDHNGALVFPLWFNDMTLGHFNWVNNIGRCQTIWHESHGRMIFEQTYPRMYDVSIEDVAQKFSELNHVNMSCRGSYGWLGNEEGMLADISDEIYEAEMPSVSTKFKDFIPSQYGIRNLQFGSQVGRWSYTEYEKFYNKYIVE